MSIGRLTTEGELLRWLEDKIFAPDFRARLKQATRQSNGGGGGGAPDPHASTHQPGGSDPMAVNASAGTGSLRSLGTGSTQAAAGNHGHSTLPSSGEKDALAGTSGTPAGGNRYVTDADARNTNARTPTAHAASHQPGGGDAMAVNAAAGTGSLRSLGTGSTNAAAGNDSRFPTTGQKAALAGTSGTPSGSNRYVTESDPALGVGTVHAVGASGEPSFQNGWSAGSPAAAFYRVGGMVYLEGTVTGGTQGSVAFTLPVGFRPPKLSVFAASRTVDDRGAVAVLTGGNVIVDHFASNSGIYLSPVHFRAA